MKSTKVRFKISSHFNLKIKTMTTQKGKKSLLLIFLITYEREREKERIFNIFDVFLREKTFIDI